MYGSRKVLCFVVVATVASTCYSQERESISVDELYRAHSLVSEIAEETAELRREMNSTESAATFLERVIEFQKRLNPIIVSIAETDAPKEAQLYAISLAIAIKETELSHWHYMNAFVSREQRYLNSGDIFLREGLSELERAKSLAGDRFRE